MIKILNKFISKVKGEKFELDEEIMLRDIISEISIRIIMLLRGRIKYAFILKKRGVFFLGSRVKLSCCRKINLKKNVTLKNGVEIRALSKNGVEIGDSATIGENTVIRCSGSFKVLGKGIKIGDNFSCGDNCFFGAAGGIEIGNDIIMGQNVRFHSENHNYSKANIIIRKQGVNNKGIKVGNNCWIGAGVVFLDGVTIGDGYVIGANTIVNKNIPDNSIAVGSPVKILGGRISE